MSRSRQSPSSSSGWFVHLMAAVCLCATVALALLARNTRHSSGDLGVGVLVVWLLPLCTGFLTALFLAFSPRRGVSRLGLGLLALMFAAALLQKLFDRS